MSNLFFEKPILNSPYEYPLRHWELDKDGQPTQKIIEYRRKAEFITHMPTPKKRKSSSEQEVFIFDEGKGLSTKDQQYELTAMINSVMSMIVAWQTVRSYSRQTHHHLGDEVMKEFKV